MIRKIDYIARIRQHTILTFRQKMDYGRFLERRRVTEVNHDDGTFSIIFSSDQRLGLEDLNRMLPYFKVMELVSPRAVYERQ